MNKLIGEAVGTFFLVFAGLSAAAFLGAGPIGIALAFGLALTAMACVMGGCHLNPAVTIGMAVAGKFPRNEVIGHVIAQIVGGVIGAGAVYMIAKGGGQLDTLIGAGFMSNGFAEHSPGGFDMQSVMLAEALATAMFMLVVLSVGGISGAPLMVGLVLAGAHLVTLQISGASLNPARSIATAVYGSGWALDQVWVFIVAPTIGAIAGGWLHKHL